MRYEPNDNKKRTRNKPRKSQEFIAVDIEVRSKPRHECIIRNGHVEAQVVVTALVHNGNSALPYVVRFANRKELELASQLQIGQRLRVTRGRFDYRQGRRGAEFLVRESALRSEYEALITLHSNLRDRSEVESRSSVERHIQVRSLRKSVFDAYNGTCCLTNCSDTESLEVAFIALPNGNPERLQVQNCLLLRSDLHKLFDHNLIGINPKSKKLRLAPCISTSEYWELAGKCMASPDMEPDGPNSEALTARWRKFGKKSAEVRKQLELQQTRSI
jgi:hypothetical protein